MHPFQFGQRTIVTAELINLSPFARHIHVMVSCTGCVSKNMTLYKNARQTKQTKFLYCQNSERQVFADAPCICMYIWYIPICIVQIRQFVSFSRTRESCSGSYHERNFYQSRWHRVRTRSFACYTYKFLMVCCLARTVNLPTNEFATMIVPQNRGNSTEGRNLLEILSWWLESTLNLLEILTKSLFMKYFPSNFAQSYRVLWLTTM